ALRRKSSTIVEYIDINDNSEWLVKSSNRAEDKHWVVHEYLASKIFRKYSGDATQSSIKLVYDSAKQTASIATQKSNDFIEFNHRTNTPVKWGCVKSGCEIVDGNIINYIANQASIYNGKKISGFELANLVSLFVDDDDITNGVNFRLMINTTKAVVTRFDYD